MAGENYKSFKEIPDPPEPSPQIQSFKKTWRPPVVNSKHIKWKPIDKTTALVVAAATGYNRPPEPPPTFEHKKPMPEKTDSIQNPHPGRIKTKNVLTEEGFREGLIDTNSVTAATIDDHETRVKKQLKVTDDLIERSRELTAAIDYLATEVRGPWAEYQELIKSALISVREQRIALGSETRLLMSALREVRQFFLDETYETEINRLHEFIDLCERLQALKESGFLDTVADTILKLNA